MSNDTNNRLLEEARELCDYFEGTLTDRLIRAAIERNDLEAVYRHVNEANVQMHLQEGTYEVSSDYEY